MDHHGTDACFEPLRQVALHDPAPFVRRMAVHSELQFDAYYALVSQDPTYQGDPVGLHIQVALSSAHKSVRLKALLGLRRLPQDTRARAALSQILGTETDPRLRSYAHHALKHQDPSYKAAFDAKARERGIAAARTRKKF
jgi:hypothetical protein